uniref:(California timema) hypothetical protein n=1 Tax=Timema californicum TaxID=61474 RepID=A0A7R9PG09_TIMCA|nr:unnamed protein product [Timema californicum]
MNIFRLLGDLSHLLAIIVLLLKIWKTRSCADLREVADSVCDSLHDEIPGSSHHLRLGLQHVHEGGVHRGFVRDHLPDVPKVQSYLRS